MSMEFHIRVIATEVLDRVEHVWQPWQFQQMLDAMEFEATEGLSEADLREYCLMSLQDLKPDEAAEVVLRARFGARLREGQIQNCSREMLDEKLWEQYADMAFHEDFFHAGSLLWEAFPRDFPTPDAVRITLDVTSVDAVGKSFLDSGPAESFFVRLLADGMPGSAVLHRMFDDPIAGGPFPEAVSIVWECQSTRNGEVVRLRILGSGYWLDALSGVKQFVSQHPESRTMPPKLTTSG